MLYLSFPRAESRAEGRQRYEEIESRELIIAWLDEHGVGWLPCGHFASEKALRSYAGQMYLDVQYDLEDPAYQSVQTFLEFEDGAMRFDDVRFWIVPLAQAMENAHHDEPGFWERWADDF
ncbi:hypothetical protein [Caballeronia sp. Lep1P3]|uniref:hypothetical protein n=1 Tax=Caballeronia sp. Lep1P3 TaxID=2878150 RepID=UPI001FD00177|nr:hypothetical protein [Caballeronia sp. Lep1P3]